MKKYLLDDGCNWYRANLHCHSTMSDGSMTPEQLKAAYKKEGYSVLCISDHEILVDHSDLDDEDFLTITGVEYSVNDDKPAYPKLVPKGRERDFEYVKVVHINFFAKDQHNTVHPAFTSGAVWGNARKYLSDAKGEEFERKYTIECINEMIKRGNDAGFLVQYNHPHWSLNSRDEYLALEGLWATEIFNYATYNEAGNEYTPYVYDDMLRSGKKLFCTMNDDNHNPGGQLLNHSFGGYNMIGAKELKYDSIMDALERGNFYCSQGPRIYALYVEDGKIKIDCSPVSSVFVSGLGRCFRHEHGRDVTHAEFDLRKEDVFFRVTLCDRNGRYANTNAYYIKDIIG